MTHYRDQEEAETSGNRPKSIKEMEEEKAAEKAAQQKWEQKTNKNNENN